MQARPPRRRLILHEIEQHRVVAGPHLPQKQRVDDLRRLDELGQHAAVGGRQLRHVRADIGRREARRHLLKLQRVRHGLLLERGERREAQHRERRRGKSCCEGHDQSIRG